MLLVSKVNVSDNHNCHQEEDDVTGFLRVQLHTNTEDGSIELT